MVQQYVQGGAFGGLNFQPIDWGSEWGSQAPVRDYGGNTGLQPFNSSSNDYSFNKGFSSSDFNYLDAGQHAGGSNPEGVGTASDPNKSNFNPSFGSIIGGMMGGPGAGGTNCSATNIGGCIKQIETWADKLISGSLIFGLGIVLIAAGLFLLAKETGVGRGAIEGVRDGLKDVAAKK